MMSVPLEWSAPAECPEDSIVRRLIAGLLAEADHGPRPLAIAGDITATPEGYALDLTLTGSGFAHHRRLMADECETLVDSTALVASLALAGKPLLESTIVEPATRTMRWDSPPPDSDHAPDPDEHAPPLRGHHTRRRRGTYATH